MKQARWNRFTEWPLTIAAVVFLIAYAIEVLADLNGAALSIADTIINVTWIVFIIDYGVTLALAERRWTWFYRHLPDLAIIALPALRPLRLLRLVKLVRTLQSTAGTAFRGRIVLYVAVATSLLVFVAALAILDIERDAPGALITTFGDAVWWAFVTITTVGYGDLYPVTATGRVIAAGVMIGGIALIGVVTATLAAWIVENVAQRGLDAQNDTTDEVSELAAELRALRLQLAHDDPRAAPAGTAASDS